MQLFGGQSCNTDRNTRIWIQGQYDRNTEFDERIILADQISKGFVLRATGLEAG